MSPKARLVASAVSSLVAILLFRVWLSKLGIPGFDLLLMFAPFAILFTIFATVGVVNAFNLIDGLNGLSSYVTASVAFSLSIIAFNAGNTQISIFLVLLVSTVLGFTVLNFPLAKIFLGDGGAYALGHLLVWSAIILINKAHNVSSFAILLCFSGQLPTQAWQYGADGSWVILPIAPTVFTSTSLRCDFSKFDFLVVTSGKLLIHWQLLS